MHLHKVCRRRQTEEVSNSGAEKPGNEATILQYHTSVSLTRVQYIWYIIAQYGTVWYSMVHYGNVHYGRVW